MAASWTSANASNHWSARYNHATVVFDDKMWVLGGNDRKPKKMMCGGAVMALAGRMQTPVTTGLLDDVMHTAVVFDDKMWVLGGLE